MATAAPLILSAQGYTDELLLGSGAFGSVRIPSLVRLLHLTVSRSTAVPMTTDSA